MSQNIGKVEFKGIDFNLSSYNLPNYKQLKWKTELNINGYVNEVLDLGGATEVSGTNYGENRAIVGEPVEFSIWQNLQVSIQIPAKN